MRRNILPGEVLEQVSTAGASRAIVRDVQRRMMAIAIRIINTWWYPRNGIRRWMPTANLTFAILAETVYRLCGR
jgi:hypothetical protein